LSFPQKEQTRLDFEPVEEEDLPEFFVSAQTINPLMRVKMQGIWQKHIDASISSTVNLPNSATTTKRTVAYAYIRQK
jgi:ribonucleotide reductase alpha subunit